MILNMILICFLADFIKTIINTLYMEVLIYNINYHYMYNNVISDQSISQSKH